MHDDRGDVDGFRANLRATGLPVHRLATVAAGNLLRRIWTPPHDCCGRPGEPGC
ncbi:MAG TPA: hypothetical protein VKR80_08540 [Candidatus Limnocylindria bacterium]|nr:hypothetical protein [Candidatus Limnocylindria bacterium]